MKPKCFEESRREAGLCPSCEVVNINGRRCHEAGCPEAWKDFTRECRECGQQFKREYERQEYCPDCEAQMRGDFIEDDFNESDDGISDDNWACGTLDPET